MKVNEATSENGAETAQPCAQSLLLRRITPIAEKLRSPRRCIHP